MDCNRQVSRLVLPVVPAPRAVPRNPCDFSWCRNSFRTLLFAHLHRMKVNTVKPDKTEPIEDGNWSPFQTNSWHIDLPNRKPNGFFFGDSDFTSFSWVQSTLCPWNLFITKFCFESKKMQGSHDRHTVFAPLEFCRTRFRRFYCITLCGIKPAKTESQDTGKDPL